MTTVEDRRGPGTTQGIGRSGRTASPNLVLAIVSAGVVLASLDLFIVNVALPSIAADLGSSSLGSLSWVLSAYAIVYASLLVFLGRMSERYRRDRAFLVGVALFTVASAACAAATSVEVLVAARVLQAVGAALLTPTSLSLLLATFPPERRAGAVRAWTALGGLAAALGPVVGGVLVALDWRWVFIVNVPIGAVALVIGWRRLPAVEGHPVARPDALGAALVTLGVAALTLGLVEGRSWGWSSGATLGAIATAVLLLGGFVLHTAVSPTPLVPPSLFTSSEFTGASVVSVFFSAGMGAMLLSIVVWLQNVWGWSALATGLAVAPGPLIVPLVSFLAVGPLVDRLGPARVIAVGSASFALGLLWWAVAVRLEPDYVAGVLGGMLVTGLGVGLTLPTLMSTAAATLPPEAFATGSGVVTMLRQTGLGLGVAVAVAVMGEGWTSPDTVLDAFRRTWWATAGIALAGALPALVLLRRRAVG